MKQILFFALFLISASINAQSPQLIVPAGHGDQVYLLKFSADGNYLFSVGTGAKIVKVWDTKSGNLLKNIPVENFPTCMQVSSDGKMLIIGTKKEVYILGFPSFIFLHKVSHGATDAVIGNNTLYFTSGETVISSIDLKTFAENTLYNGGDAQLLSLSPNGENLFIISTFNTLVLDLKNGKIKNQNQQEIGTSAIGYTPVGNIFGFNNSTKKGDWVGLPVIINPETGKRLLDFNFKVPGSARLQSLKNQVAYGNNNRVVVSRNGSIIIADYLTGKKTGEIKTPNEDIIALAASGDMVVAGDKFKGTLKQYDIN